MTSTTHPHESTAPALSVAIELGAKEWLLTMSVAPGERRRRARIRPGDRAAWTAGDRRRRWRWGSPRRVRCGAVTKRGGTASGRTGG